MIVLIQILYGKEVIHYEKIELYWFFAIAWNTDSMMQPNDDWFKKVTARHSTAVHHGKLGILAFRASVMLQISFFSYCIQSNCHTRKKML